MAAGESTETLGKQAEETHAIMIAVMGKDDNW